MLFCFVLMLGICNLIVILPGRLISFCRIIGPICMLLTVVYRLIRRGLS
jgi:hypothetical protein